MSWGTIRLSDVFGGRLTCSTTTGAAAGEEDSATGATSVYLVPFRGQRHVSLYYAGVWQMFPLPSRAELTLASTASATLYDVFAYWTGSAVALEQSTAWSGATTRSVALAEQDGTYVKSGDATRRYVGTFRTTVSGETESSTSKRFVWSYYSRRERRVLIGDTTSHTYGSATPRRWNNGASGALGGEFVVGQATIVTPGFHAKFKAASASNAATVSLYLDGVAANLAVTSEVGSYLTLGAAGRPQGASAGYHVFDVYEFTDGATGTFADVYGGITYDG